MYSEVSKDEWMDALFNSLQSHRYDVKRCKSTKTTSHYCQFSGGGYIHVHSKNIGTLVFVSSAEKTPDEESSVGGGNEKVFPLAHGTSKLSLLSIEGKKGSIPSAKLKYQLWANMITLVIGRFITAVDPPKGQSVNQLFTKHIFLNSMNLQGMGWHVLETEWLVYTN